MKKTILTLCALVMCVGSFAQKVTQNASYQFFVDLTTVKNDKLEVSLIAPKINKDEITYNLPKIVPGTYANYDFGRYITDFKAFDAAGKALKVEKLDKNSYKIAKAKSLYKITYLVDDTWDSPKSVVNMCLNLREQILKRILCLLLTHTVSLAISTI
jgi:predicted metalloprotease with PDZ domain